MNSFYIGLAIYLVVAVIFITVNVFQQGYHVGTRGYFMNGTEVKNGTIFALIWPLALPLALIYNLGLSIGVWRIRSEEKIQKEYDEATAVKPSNEITDWSGYGPNGP